jgi:hypothetical protein
MNPREVRRTRLYAAYEEAANDPVFMAETRATTEAFEGTTADGLGYGGSCAENDAATRRGANGARDGGTPEGLPRTTGP